MSCCVDQCIVDANGDYFLAVINVAEVPPVTTYIDLATGAAGTPVAPTEPCEIPDEEVFVGGPGADPNATVGAPEADRGWFYDEDGAAWYWDPTAGVWEQFTSGCCLAQWCVQDAAGDQFTSVVLIDNGVPGAVVYLDIATGAVGTPVAPVEPCESSVQSTLTDNADGTATYVGVNDAGVATTCVLPTESIDVACNNFSLETTTTDLKTGAQTIQYATPSFGPRRFVQLLANEGAIDASTPEGTTFLAGFTTLDLPECGGRIHGVVHYGMYQTAATPEFTDGVLGLHVEISWDGGASWVTMNGAGVEQWIARQGFTPAGGELSGTRSIWPNAILTGSTMVGYRIVVDTNTLVGSGQISLSTSTLLINHLIMRCC